MKYIMILWNGFWGFLLFSVMIGLLLVMFGVATELITPVAFTLSGVIAASLTCIRIIQEIAEEPEGVQA
ncbi:hypothetical protein KAR91_63020 [Candidatus Pacearchaeota archaeon]|nr:hypothetical protein [Candidatus Pacearchaeota archaeon]